MSRNSLRAETNCLSLDGGGVRSLSSLLILEEILRQYNLAHPLGANGQRPDNVFHVAFGTSGGGLSALMIKRYALPMKVCIDNLSDVSHAVFRRRASLLNFDLGALISLFVGSRFSQGLLQRQIERITGARTYMQNPPQNCNCYVVSRRTDPFGSIIEGQAVCFACFANERANCLVWQAALATSAAPTYFPPVRVGPLGYYIDGGLGFNNPISTLEDQKASMNIGDHQRVCIISIGTGEPTSPEIQTARSRWWRFWARLNWVNVFRNTLALATDTQAAHEKFKKGTLNKPNVSYFRFNCDGGLADIPLDQASQLPIIEKLTKDYLAKPQTQAMIQDAVRAMAEPGR